jgi:Tol biopolymer transport system component
MYFTSNSGGTNHIWRQHFPNGRPEQFTFGPTEQEGIAISADGRSLVTAVVLQNTSLWIHDAKGEREVSLEGNGTKPKFTPDGKSLCYLMVKEASSKFAWFRNPGELRIANLESGRSEAVVRGFDVQDYDISADGKRVVMGIIDDQGKSRLWVADLDRTSPPFEIPNVEGVEPLFGPGGDVFFRHAGSVFRVHPDGIGLQKILAGSVASLRGVSPDGKWIVAWAPGRGTAAQLAFPLDGGPPVVIGGPFIFLSWSLDGRSVLLGDSYLVPLSPDASLPPIPEGGFRSEEEIALLPGVRRINENGLVLGPSADLYAFYRGTVQRNLYSIPIP